MISFIRDLYGHQAWADAEHWKAIHAFPAAAADPTIRKRLHHIHLVQRLFLRTVTSIITPHDLRGDDLAKTVAAGFPEPADLGAYAREYHDDIAPVIAGLTGDQIAARVRIPWFKDPPLELSVGEALTQTAMHSHYHRGQNATRLRELGGEPPGTDLIVWYWKSRPAADWTR